MTRRRHARHREQLGLPLVAEALPVQRLVQQRLERTRRILRHSALDELTGKAARGGAHVHRPAVAAVARPDVVGDR
jgi:hypothetical protein